ncbi:hypothetical protein [Cytophaga aurantiaca]|uniref:hypothetical protein n=1 Tax=Cytophaga aurantiaca TaxID=29530 RepID=UPI0003827DF6|nr:hypothetical protein [Cytophaga aurantiaca]
METDLNFFEEVHLKGDSTKKKTVSSNASNFKKGILIGGASIVVILAIVSFQNSENFYSYEDAALHLDSIQIQQNNRIIELLETRTQRDTTIVHVIAPTSL